MWWQGEEWRWDLPPWMSRLKKGSLKLFLSLILEDLIDSQGNSMCRDSGNLHWSLWFTREPKDGRIKCTGFLQKVHKGLDLYLFLTHLLHQLHPDTIRGPFQRGTSAQQETLCTRKLRSCPWGATVKDITSILWVCSCFYPSSRLIITGSAKSWLCLAMELSRGSSLWFFLLLWNCWKRLTK